jgi:hypothetical protein
MFRGRGRGWGWAPGWGWGYLPYPDYDDYADYNEYPNYSGYPDHPPVIAAAPQPDRVIQPMLLEKRGDQWVQVTGYPPAPAQAEALNAAETTYLRAVVPGGNESAEPPRELPPDVLVFRDGHEEEVKSYTIIGNTLYAKANYWASGSWTREIGIADLDVPATLKLNQERGTKFRLPSGPQEVMIRP